MTAEEAVAAVRERLSDAQLQALAALCEPLATPSSSLGHAVAGSPPGTVEVVAALGSAWRQHPDLSGAGIALALRTGLSARQDADARRARPVWTGPGTVGEQRLTAATLHQLITGAQERILLVSYAAYTLPEIATDLEAAVQRGCQVDVVFETEEDSAGLHGSGPTVRAARGHHPLALAGRPACCRRRAPRQATHRRWPPRPGRLSQPHPPSTHRQPRSRRPDHGPRSHRRPRKPHPRACRPRHPATRVSLTGSIAVSRHGRIRRAP